MNPRDLKLGQRVVHIRTKGRLRGVVQRILLGTKASTADILLDGLRGQVMPYDINNLELESSWVDPPPDKVPA